uniref:Uncharacterized protein n=1 Tax=Anguilla anguilla TaxID=7936 RepID=A0A0E9XKK6_ANGAN
MSSVNSTLSRVHYEPNRDLTLNISPCDTLSISGSYGDSGGSGKI